MNRKGTPVRVLRDALAGLVRRVAGHGGPRGAGPGDHWPGEVFPAAYPQTVFLLGGLAPGARKALEVFPREARAWRTLAEMEAARSRVRSGEGRVWDAGVCAGRAQAYRAAAEQMEEVLMESLELWDEYERQTGERER